MLADGVSFTCMHQAFTDEFDASCFLGADKSMSFMQRMGLRALGLVSFPSAMLNLLMMKYDRNALTEKKIDRGDYIRGPYSCN